MENENPEMEKHEPEADGQQEGYVSRPAWQVWGARIGLVAFVIFLIMVYINIARGGA